MSIYCEVHDRRECECDRKCHIEISYFATYTPGHYPRTPECLKKQSDSMKADWASITPEEHASRSKALSKADLERYANMGIEEHRELAQSLSDSWTPEMKEVARLRRRKWNLEQWAAGTHPAALEVNKEKARQAVRKLWTDPNYVAYMALPMNHGVNPKNKPNELEKYALKIIEEVAPGRFKYNMGEVVVGTKIPDFYELSGEDLLIEIFGSYWHTLDNPKQLSDEELVTYYKEKGKRCLVLWDEDVYYGNTEGLIRSFLAQGG